MGEPAALDMEKSCRLRNLEYFLTKLFWWYLAIGVTLGVTSYLVLTVPSESEPIVVVWLGAFTAFILAGVLVARVVGYKHFIVRHGIIVANTPDMQQVIKEEREEVQIPVKDIGYRCKRCNSDKLYLHEDESGICKNCGKGFHSPKDLVKA